MNKAAARRSSESLRPGFWQSAAFVLDLDCRGCGASRYLIADIRL